MWYTNWEVGVVEIPEAWKTQKGKKPAGPNSLEVVFDSSEFSHLNA